MDHDPELEAMSAIVSAFEGLEVDAQGRVFAWLTDRYSRLSRTASAVGATTSGPMEKQSNVAEAASVSRGSDLEQLYATVSPNAQWERVLVTGYWLQEIKRHDDFDALAVTQAMRHSKYDVSNISRELTKLTNGKLLVLDQSHNEAGHRRRFRVSRDGLRWVKKRLTEPEV